MLLAAFEALPDVTVVVDSRGQIRYLNRRARALWDDPEARLVGRPLAEILSDPRLHLPLQEPDAPTLIGVQERVAGRSPRTFDVKTSEFEHDGELFLVLSLRDSTRRLASEQALRQSEQGYRSLFDASPLPTWVFDVETLRIRAVNPIAVREYGYTREEFLSLTLHELRRPEEHARLDAEIAEIRRGGELSRVGLWRHKTKDGRLIDVELIGLAMVYEGRPARLVMARDVTEERQNEEHDRHAQKMEAIGRLAGGVAHDFNNMLSVILSYASMLSADFDERDPRRADLEEIRKAGQRAATLCNQLLTFSRRQVLQPAAVDLNAAVGDMERMLRPLIGENIHFSTVLGAEVDAVHADPHQIEQVLVNLVLNARDAMPRGGTLTIATSNVLLDERRAATLRGVSPGPHAMLAVSDTGIGMDAATRARIFEPFFSTKERSRGAGLGLATVYAVVQQSGGAIEVDSEVGGGSTFRIFLPRREATQAEADAEARGAPGLGGRETILLVEDEDLVRRTARTVLRRQGYAVLEAASGAEALRILERESGRVKLLLSDVVMPGMSGPELAEKVAVVAPGLRVLLMSGYTDGAALGPEHSETPFLHKPFSPDSLARRVREVLDS